MVIEGLVSTITFDMINIRWILLAHLQRTTLLPAENVTWLPKENVGATQALKNLSGVRKLCGCYVSPLTVRMA